MNLLQQTGAALWVLIHPSKAWEQIAAAKRGFAWALLMVLLPWILLSTGLEYAGLQHWGERSTGFGSISRLSQHQLLTHAAYQAASGFLLGFLGSLLIFWIARGLHDAKRYGDCFLVTSYALGAVFLCRVLDGLPVLPTWLCMAAGIVACIFVLYNGIGLVLRPSHSSGFALYLVSGLLMAILIGLVHTIGVALLRGRLSAL